MPRKAKGIHSSPEHCGKDIMPEATVRTQDELQTMEKLLPAYHIGLKNRQDYKGLWNEGQLRDAVTAFFEYCAEYSVKPSKTGLGMWLGITRQTYNEWQTKPEKYGFKYDILQFANDIIAFSYENRVESYPTGNIFLLKASHGMNEVTKVEISNPNNVSKEDIADAVSKLGLDE